MSCHARSKWLPNSASAPPPPYTIAMARANDRFPCASNVVVEASFCEGGASHRPVREPSFTCLGKWNSATSFWQPGRAQTKQDLLGIKPQSVVRSSKGIWVVLSKEEDVPQLVRQMPNLSALVKCVFCTGRPGGVGRSLFLSRFELCLNSLEMGQVFNFSGEKLNLKHKYRVAVWWCGICFLFVELNLVKSVECREIEITKVNCVCSVDIPFQWGKVYLICETKAIQLSSKRNLNQTSLNYKTKCCLTQSDVNNLMWNCGS